MLKPEKNSHRFGILRSKPVDVNLTKWKDNPILPIVTTKHIPKGFLVPLFEKNNTLKPYSMEKHTLRKQTIVGTQNVPFTPETSGDHSLLIMFLGPRLKS